MCAASGDLEEAAAPLQQPSGASRRWANQPTDGAQRRRENRAEEPAPLVATAASAQELTTRLGDVSVVTPRQGSQLSRHGLRSTRALCQTLETVLFEDRSDAAM
ncbi:hypothetical protein MRX96_046719 [Rhipicephalus microplus]